MRTIKQIIDTDPTTEAEHAVRAAYWAGLEEARGRIARDLEARAGAHPLGRYRHVVASAIAAMLPAAGSVRDDSDEILGWTVAA